MLDTDRSKFQHPEKRSSPETPGTRCHMCRLLTCKEKKQAKLHRWTYYCNALHREFTFKELYGISKEECPEHREIRRRFR